MSRHIRRRAPVLCATALLAAASPAQAEVRALVGRVLDAAGNPLLGAAVRQSAPDAFVTAVTLARPDARTGPDGRFRLPLRMRSVDHGVVHIAKPGKAAMRRVVVVAHLQPDSGGAASLGDLVLGDGVTLHGRCGTAVGEAIAGVRVVVEDALPAPPRRPPAQPASAALSGPDGAFSIDGCCESGLRVTFTAPGYYRERIAPASRLTALNATLTPSPLVRGQCVDGDGRPAPVDLRVTYEGGESTTRLRTADGARFAFHPVHPGRLRIRAESTGEGREIGSALVDDPRIAVVLAVASPAVRRLVVRCVDADSGRAIPAFRGRVEWRWTRVEDPATLLLAPREAASEGTLALPGPVGHGMKGALCVAADGRAPVIRDDLRWDSVDARRSVEVEVGRFAAVGGTVTQSRGVHAAPIVGASARVILQTIARASARPPSDRDDLVATTTADGRGRFAFANLPPGRYAISARALTRSERGRATPVVLARGAARMDLAVELPAGKPIRGRVWESGSSPSFTPGWSAVTQRGTRRAQLAANGVFEIPDVAPGIELGVFLEPPRTPRRGQPLRIPAGRAASGDARIEMDWAQAGPAWIRGRVQREGGGALPWDRLCVVATSSPRPIPLALARGPRTMVEADGSYALELRRGSYRLRVVDLATGLDLLEDASRLRVGMSETRELDLPIHTAEVRVTLVDPPGGVRAAMPARIELRPIRASARGRPDLLAAIGVTVRHGQRDVRFLAPLGELELTVRSRVARILPRGHTPARAWLARTTHLVQAGDDNHLRIAVPPVAAVPRRVK